jgi:hypothetical protein
MAKSNYFTGDDDDYKLDFTSADSGLTYNPQPQMLQGS